MPLKIVLGFLEAVISTALERVRDRSCFMGVPMFASGLGTPCCDVVTILCVNIGGMDDDEEEVPEYLAFCKTCALLDTGAGKGDGVTRVVVGGGILLVIIPDCGLAFVFTHVVILLETFRRLLEE
mmetsp:Transcript_7023/g.7793  ORF Transcript_7023/g.7793 Transcript_7023/m.7793 type:complete len:125 (-) Transcript_7023:204-578(-)